LDIEKLPQSLAIIGGGIIGMEFASIFNSLGTKVTVLEFLPSILGNIDSDIVKRVLPMFKKRGIEIFTQTKVTSISHIENDYTISGTDKNNNTVQFKSSNVLISTGRKPYFEKLGLENIFPHSTKPFIEVDNMQRTEIDNIYAIGDVTGGWMLAHTAAHQGIVAAQNIMYNNQNDASHATIPSCIFTFPEIAFAGITEDTAKKENIPYKTSKFMFGANGKALCMGEGEGFVKVIAKPDGKVLGVHIMGPHASDLIQEAVLAIEKGITTAELSNIVHAHPTLSEALSESFMGIEKMAIHMANQ
jgi:dihydrolipoamide dehydrogenase